LAPWVRRLRAAERTLYMFGPVLVLDLYYDTVIRTATFMRYGCTATDKSQEGGILERDRSNGPSVATCCPADSKKNEAILTRIIGFE
jgi:hypothetical protein